MKQSWLAVVVVVASSTWAGCSEAVSNDDDAGGKGGAEPTSATGTTTRGASGTASASTRASGPSSSPSASTGAVVEGDVVINEISASEDYVELFNRGGAAVDLGGKVLADLDATTMGPKVADAISFPPGTSLAPGGYLFVLAKQDAVVMPGEQMPQTVCAPGASPCFYAPFGLSDADGDALFLLDGDTVIAQGDYPPTAAPDGSTWCRIPDGTGAFGVCSPTPSAANAP